MKHDTQDPTPEELAPAAILRRTGIVHWYRWNGQDLAVREGTMEERLLQRYGAPEVDQPADFVPHSTAGGRHP